MDKILNHYNNKDIFYLAPEEIAFITRPTASATFPNPKSEAFSLGMSILEAALLENSENIYTLSPRAIDIQELQRRLGRLQSRYPLLFQYLSLILAENPASRLSAAQLWVMMKVHSSEIHMMRPFNRDARREESALQNFLTTGRTSQ